MTPKQPEEQSKPVEGQGGERRTLAEVKATIIRERQKILNVIESRREFPDDFHVLDGKQGGLLQAIHIIEHIERFGTAPEGFPIARRR